MNIEQTKEAIRVMQAFVDGKKVESMYDGKWASVTVPRWSWDDTQYRIKPTPILRPWTSDEVPLGAWIRTLINPANRWVITYTANELVRSDWFSDHEHSTDGGKTWHPCGVMEEAK